MNTISTSKIEDAVRASLPSSPPEPTDLNVEFSLCLDDLRFSSDIGKQFREASRPLTRLATISSLGVTRQQDSLADIITVRATGQDAVLWLAKRINEARTRLNALPVRPENIAAATALVAEMNTLDAWLELRKEYDTAREWGEVARARKSIEDLGINPHEGQI